MLDQGERICLRIDGEGAESALSHLAHHFPMEVADGRLRLDDESFPAHADNAIVTVRTRREAECDAVRRLAPWCRDDFIEYLLAVHPSQCASVMQRLRSSIVSGLFAGGSPSVWQMVLDRMAGDETLDDVERTVLDELHQRINSPSLSDSIADRLIFPASSGEIGVFGHPGSDEPDDLGELFSRSRSPVRQYFFHQDVCGAFAAQRFVNRLETDEIEQIRCLLSGPIAWHKLSQLSGMISGRSQILSKLQTLFGRNRRFTTANCASLLVACRPGWIPTGERLQLSHGNFQRVVWPKIDLKGADLRESCFSEADLAESSLTDASIGRTDFSDANLQGTNFEQKEPLNSRKTYSRTNFTGANLSRANLSRCRFRSADFGNAMLELGVLQKAWFEQTSFVDADLSGADFTDSAFNDVDFRGAILDRCRFVNLDADDGLNLEDLRAENVDFTRAKLCRSQWTASTLMTCKFCGADLTNSRMAHIDWQSCDLRGADLRGCTFLMGSTRCGLVGSPYPSHGTRTGFYTDDYDDQHFQPPEAIRKASLINADLRGANIQNVDFYLVDLRGANYDSTQRRQLIATGAILDP